MLLKEPRNASKNSQIRESVGAHCTVVSEKRWERSEGQDTAVDTSPHAPQWHEPEHISLHFGVCLDQ